VVSDADRGVEIAWDLVGVGELRDELGGEILCHKNPQAARCSIEPKAHGARQATDWGAGASHAARRRGMT
jgi:hypothetical protein